MDLNIWYFQWYISIKNQRTSPIKVSSIDLMRAECHDRLSIANGCSRDVVLSHMFLQSKKKKERTLDFNRYKTPPWRLCHGIKIPFQKMKGWNSFPKNALSSMCRRWLLLRWRREKICNNTTTKKRTQKRRETRPRKSKLSVLEPPLSVLSQLFSFIHLPCGRRDTKTLDLYL